MVTLRCQGCGRIVTMSQDKYDSHDEWDCSQCRDSLVLKDSEDDCYEESKEDEEESNQCIICGEELTKEQELLWDSNDCDDYGDYDYLCICKKCIDKKYPRDIKPQIVYKEKIVEKPIIKYIDNNGKEVSKQQTNQIFNSVF